MSRPAAVDEEFHIRHEVIPHSCGIRGYIRSGWGVESSPPRVGWGALLDVPPSGMPPSERAFRRARAGAVPGACLRQRAAERLEGGLGNVMVVLAGGLDVHGAA